MKLFIAFVSTFLLMACSTDSSSAQSQTVTAEEFSKLIQEHPDYQLLDVRTAGEYAQGFIEGAININYNSAAFSEECDQLDKSKPVLLYCLSGGRSAGAARLLREKGFEVTELKGGILQWNAAGLPLVLPGQKQQSGSNSLNFDEVIKSDKLVLVDFYAQWCQPCKKMEPSLNEISNEMGEQVKVVRIDIEEHPEIAQKFSINQIPTLHYYSDSKLVASELGYKTKEQLVERINTLQVD